MTPEIVVIGGINSDHAIRGRRLPFLDSVQGTSFHQGVGGKGANQAVAAARLGAHTALVGKVGRDFRGSEILRQIEREEVSTKFVRRASISETGAALLMVDQKGTKQTMAYPGANAALSTWDIRSAAGIITRAKAVLVQLEVPLEAARLAMRLAVGGGARVILDPSPVPVGGLDDVYLRLADVVRMNSREAEQLTGIEVSDRAGARVAAEQLLWRGRGGAAIVEVGGEGNLLVSDESEHWIPNFPVQAVDTTGAGDAFAATVAVAISRGFSLSRAAELGAAAAALASQDFGAQSALPSWQEVIRLLERPEAA